MQTKEQLRAKFALEKIQKLDRLDEKTANFIVGMPTMILTNGIGQSLAFLASKGEAKHTAILNFLQEWLSNEIEELRSNNYLEFISKFSNINQKTYLKAQREAIAILSWLKRYARAFGEQL